MSQTLLALGSQHKGLHKLVLRGEAVLEKGYIVEIVVKRVISKKNATKLLVIPLVTHFMGRFSLQNSSKQQRIDQLQNQLNQVLLMLQQNGSHGIFSSKSTTLPKFTATLNTCLQIAWIIDSGAIDHICTALRLLHNIYKCKTPITVNLPNGQTVKVTTVGSNKRIALGNLCDDLYFLSSPPKVSATTPTILHSSSKSQLWHSRQGLFDNQLMGHSEPPFESVRDK
ncbi:hypothetical protein Tco_0059687 [Tanacetum coccineum]